MNNRITHIILFFALIVCLFLSCDSPLFIIPREPDTTPPSATMVNPPHGAILSDEVLIEVKAEDNDGIDSVEIFIDDILVAVDIDSPYIYIWSTLDTLFFDDDTLTSREDGQHSITSKVTDRSENHVYTIPILINIDNFDNIPPVGELLDIYWGITVQNTITLTVEASDNHGIRSVTFYRDDITLITDYEEPYLYNWNTLNLEDDSYTIRALIEDWSENRTTVGPVQVIVDNIPDIDITPPNVVITYPSAAQTVQDQITITAEATDNVSVSYVEFFINGESVFVDTDSPYQYFWDTLDPSQATEDAEHILHVVAIDPTGNAASPSPITVTVDNTESEPPVVIITGPSAGQTVSGTVHISIVATDNVAISSVECTLNDEILFTDDTAPYNYDWNTSSIEDDTWQILQVSATDVNGITSISTPITVLVDNHDDAAPSGMITNPYAGQIVSGDVNIQVAANDNTGVQSVQFTIDGVTVFTDADYPYEYLWDTQQSLEDDDHIISILISDNYGNSTSLQPISVFVDNIPTGDDSPPTVTIQYPLSGQTVQGIVQIEVSALDDIGIDSISYMINQETLYSGPHLPTFEWNTVLWGPNGEATIQIEVTDPSGNTAHTQPIYVIVDNVFEGTPESIYAETIQPGEIQITWASSLDAIHYRLYKNDQFLIQTETLSYLDTDIVPNTTYCYVVTAVNSFEIESSPSSPACSEDILTAVSNLTATAQSVDEISLTWSALDGASSYQIHVNGIAADTTAAPSFLHSSLSSDTEYCYSVTGLDASGDPGISSTDVCATTHTTLTAPTLSLTVETSSFNLSWTSVPTASGYHVYRDGSFLTETVSLSYQDVSVDPGVEFCYYVIAVNEYGTIGPSSNEECGRLTLQAPATITADAVSTTGIIVTWTSVTGAASYQLYQNGVLIYGSATSPYTVEGLDSNSQYCYYVIPVDADGFSGISSTDVCATTHTTLTAPTLSLTVETSSFNLSWTSVPTASGYHVYRDGSFLTETASLSYQDASVDPGLEFCYYVIAVNEYGTTGPSSNEECGRLAIQPPADFMATGGNQSVFLNWSETQGAASYNLYLSGSGRNLEFLANTTETIYNHEGLEYLTSYCYAISCVDVDGFEGPVSVDECTTTDPEPSPLPPTMFTVTQADTVAELNWVSSVSDNIEFVLIYKDGNYYTAVDGITQTYTDTTVTQSVEYCYYLIARTFNQTDSDPTPSQCITIQ